MVRPTETYSLADFQRNAKKHVQRLKECRQPEVLTINGKAEVVVQDAKAYEELLEVVERAEAIEGIQRGLDSMQCGEGSPAVKVLDTIREKYAIPREP